MRKAINIWILSLLLLVCNSGRIYAIKANPNPVTVIQPDGTTITVRIHGDENFNFVTTIDGYLIRIDKDGFFKYIDTNKGTGLNVLSDRRASDFVNRNYIENEYLNTLTPAAKMKDRIETEIARREKKAPEQILNRTISNPARFAKSKAIAESQYLVILVNFKDRAFSFKNEDFETWLNQKGYSENGGTGSVKDYYTDNSMGQFIPNFVVLGPYTLEHEQVYYAGNDESTGEDQNPRAMIYEACTMAKAANPDIDFSQFDNDKDGFMDNVNIIYAGYSEASTANSDDMWPHSWTMSDEQFTIDGITINNYACSAELVGASGTAMDGIGTFTHEFGHVLGLKDMYDTDQYTNGYGIDPGAYSLYASGSYNNDSRTPPYLMAFERVQLGWCEPEEMKDAEDVTLQPLKNNMARYINAQPDRTPGTGYEWFVFENRQQEGWDKYIPAHGLLIYHYDYTDEMVEQYWSINGPNNNAKHRCMYIKVADGIDDTNSRNGDTYPGSSGNTEFTDTSVPNALNWNGEKTNTPVTNITEKDGIIYFQVKGGTSEWSVIKTEQPSDIRDTSVKAHATIVNAMQQVKEAGFCWKLNAEPDIDDNHVKSADNENITCDITGLEPGSIYNIRAYMILNDNSVVYGSSIPFTTECKVMNAPFVGDFTSWTNGEPDCWKIVDNNGDGTTWIYDSSSEAMVYQFDYWNNADDWLISTRMLVPENGCLYFVRGVTESTTVEILDVYVSTKSRDMNDFHLLKRYSFADSFGEQKPEEVDLSQYEGKEIYIAFVCRSEKLQNNLWLWQIYLASKLDTPTITDFSKTGNSLNVAWTPVENAKRYYLEFAEVTDEVFNNAVFVPSEYFEKMEGNVDAITGTLTFTGDGIAETRDFPEGITNCMFIMTASGPAGNTEVIVEGTNDNSKWEQLGTILKATTYDNEGKEVLLSEYMQDKTYRKLRFRCNYGGINVKLKYLTIQYNDGKVWNYLAQGSVDGTSTTINEQTTGEFSQGKTYAVCVYSGDGILFYDPSEIKYLETSNSIADNMTSERIYATYDNHTVTLNGVNEGSHILCTTLSGIVIYNDKAETGQISFSTEGVCGLITISVTKDGKTSVLKLIVK